ncbi:MAG: iron-siderophore ABC transporter substrate-binding protein [Cyanobacteria bacterium P01_E01_bin.6]
MLLAPLAIIGCQDLSNAPPQHSTSPTHSNVANCRTIQHEAGETDICGQPQRIAVLGPFILEPLLALDIQPVAFADHNTWHQGDYDDPRQQIPYLGQYITNGLTNLGSAWQPSVEALVKLKPDLILGAAFNNAEQYETLSAIAPTMLLTWDNAELNLRAIAQAVGSPEKAEQVLLEMDEQVANGRNRFTSFVADHPNVLLISTDSRLQDIYMGNSAHGLCSSLLIDLGFNLVSVPGLKDNQPGAAVPISLEALTQANTDDVIIMLSSSEDTPTDMEDFSDHQLSGLKQSWEENAIAQSFNASKAGRVYFIPAYLCLGLPGPIGTKLYLEELQERLLPLQE